MSLAALTPSAAFTKDSIARHLAAGHPITVRRGEQWCCLVCLRQFTSERHVERHVVRSALHATNLANAVAAGRVPPSLSDVARPAKRERSAVEANLAGGGGGGGGGSGGGGSLSALEQMELFEKRLKGRTSTDKIERVPEKKAVVDSTHARSVNGQMDWDCSKCNAFNFARVVVCYKCGAHVDSTTHYLTNRLKDLKQQRFAHVFQDDKSLSKFAQPPPPQEARADGSFGDGSRSRASFHA